MDYTKQLIKAINDLTKAVDRNTKAYKESVQERVNEIDSDFNPNDIKNGTPDDLKQWYKNQRGENMYGVHDSSNGYKKGAGGFVGSPTDMIIGDKDIKVSTNEVVLTQEMINKMAFSNTDKPFDLKKDMEDNWENYIM